MKIERLASAVVVGFVCSIAPAQSTAVHWRVEDGGNGHWYQAVNHVPSLSPESWFTYLITRGAVAASVASTPESQVVYSISYQGGEFTQAVLGAKRNASKTSSTGSTGRRGARLSGPLANPTALVRNI